jgi:hypothetical protein
MPGPPRPGDNHAGTSRFCGTLRNGSARTSRRIDGHLTADRRAPHGGSDGPAPLLGALSPARRPAAEPLSKRYSPAIHRHCAGHRKSPVPASDFALLRSIVNSSESP